MKDFLKNKQVKELAKKGYSVKPKGFRVGLYAEDFTEMAWKEYCNIVGVCTSSKEIVIVGVAYENN